MEISLNGLPVYYEQAGTKGQNVLLLHGWGCTSGHFAPIIKDLSADYRVTAIDFPAHGHTPEPPAPWDVHDFARLTAELIRGLALCPVDIIAHSFGARVAVCLAAESPDLVRRLVLTGAAGIRKPPDEKSARRTEAFRKRRDLAERLGKLPGMGRLMEQERERLIRRYGSPDYAALAPSMRQTFSRIVSEDLSPLLGRIRASTLLVFGGNDTETPLWMARQMEQDIPDAGLVVFENRGHFAYLEEWQRFDTIVRAFLTETTENPS